VAGKATDLAAMAMNRHPVITVGILIGVTALLVCGGVAAFRVHDIQVHYHRWRMERAHQAYLGAKTISGGFVVIQVPNDAVDRYEYHRQKLVELRDIVERQYVLKHLEIPTDESKHFSKLLVSRDCPSHIDFESPYPDKPRLLQVTIWCYPPHVSEWDRFIAEHDVPNYRERFMDAGTTKGHH